jgi:hypothetical protein
MFENCAVREAVAIYMYLISQTIFHLAEGFAVDNPILAK